MSANAQVSVVCERCGASFHVKPSRLLNGSKTRFCSRACRVVTNDPAHFWARVDIRGPDECWPWTGSASRTKGRYGATFFNGKHRQAHQVAFFLTHGYWGPYLRHRCDFGLCCNEAHLLEGTHLDNMHDKVERGRQPRGETSPVARLTVADVLAIRRDERRQQIIATDYGVHPAHVSRVRAGKIWRHVK